MSKRVIRQPLSETQLEVMEIIWRNEEVTVVEVWEEFCKRRKVARNTIQTVMSRLKERGWLKRRVRGNIHLFSAAEGRQPAIDNMVERLVDLAFHGSAGDLVMSLLEGRGVDSDEADRIRNLIEKSEAKKE